MYRPIAFKAFQQKLKQAEDSAAKVFSPGVHSGGSGEDSEEMPQRVVILYHYFELKIKQVSKSAQQEHVCVQI